MLHALIVQLEDPLYELAVVTLAVTLYVTIRAVRRDPAAFSAAGLRARMIARRQHGSAQLAQQAINATINIAVFAFAVSMVGYAVYKQAQTWICSQNLTQIAAAEDLRYSRGYGYTTNGSVTAAAFVDSDGNNDYMTVDPHDPAAAKTANYTFAATTTNGDTTYTVKCPGTHAGWTTTFFQNGGSTKTGLQFVGPGGNVQAI